MPSRSANGPSGAGKAGSEPKLPVELERELVAIRADNTSGAVDLVCRAAEVVRAASHVPSYTRAVCLAAVRAQPTMAPMVNLADMVLKGLDGGESAAKICGGFVKSLAAAGERIAKRAAGLVEEDMTVLTHSYSRTVLDGLTAAARTRKSLNVICTESRPAGEGISLARRLHETGIEVTVVTDASVYRVMNRADLVMCGADSVMADGFVNKTGTALLALAARERGRPLYVLCGTQKFLPRGWTATPERSRPADEIVSADMAGILVDNRYFETTPLDLVRGVVTEAAILAPAEIRALLPERAHPELLSRTNR